MMGTRGYLALGVSGYLFFLLSTLPAGLVWSWLAIDPSVLVLGEMSGTPWSGTAGRVVVAHFETGPLHWRVSPESLLRLAPRVDFSLDGPDGLHLQGAVVGEKELILNVRNLTFVASLEGLTPLRMQLPVDLLGRVALRIDHLAVNREGRILAIDAGGNFEDLMIGVPWDKKLGGFTLEAELGVEGEVLIHIKDVHGVLRTALVLKIYPDGRYSLRGSLKGGKDMDDQMANLLRQWIGFERNKQFPVRIQGYL